MSNFKRRIAKLERELLPAQRVIVVLGTPENQALVAKGFLPDPPHTGATPASGGKRDLQRLGKRDVVIFLLEAEMRL